MSIEGRERTEEEEHAKQGSCERAGDCGGGRRVSWKSGRERTNTHSAMTSNTERGTVGFVELWMRHIAAMNEYCVQHLTGRATVAVDGHDAVIGTFVVVVGPANELGELDDADDF